jgi:hypothetical protein
MQIRQLVLTSCCSCCAFTASGSVIDARDLHSQSPPCPMPRRRAPMVLVPSAGRSQLTADEQATQEAIVRFHMHHEEHAAAAEAAAADVPHDALAFDQNGDVVDPNARRFAPIRLPAQREHHVDIPDHVHIAGSVRKHSYDNRGRASLAAASQHVHYSPVNPSPSRRCLSSLACRTEGCPVDHRTLSGCAIPLRARRRRQAESHRSG